MSMLRLKRFSNFLLYALVGVLNTAVHWCIFLSLFYLAGMPQGPANFIGFACAVTVSFFVNARVTFKSSATLSRYVGYTVFLGALAYLTGALAQSMSMPPLVTAAGFSAISLTLGYLYSRFFIFAEPNT